MNSDNGHGMMQDAAADGFFPSHYDAVLSHYSKSFQGLQHEILHEMDAVGPPIHIHVITPPDTPFRLLLTEGMSAGAMRTLIQEKRFAELALLIPRDITFTVHTDPAKHPQGWIIDMLRYIAKFPHLDGSWVDLGHIVQAGAESDTTFGTDCEFSGGLLLQSVTLWEEMTNIRVNDGIIRVMSVFPLYKEEIQYRIDHGINALLERITAAQMSEMMEIGRPNLCIDPE